MIKIVTWQVMSELRAHYTILIYEIEKSTALFDIVMKQSITFTHFMYIWLTKHQQNKRETLETVAFQDNQIVFIIRLMLECFVNI